MKCYTLLLNDDRSTVIRSGIEPMPATSILAAVPDDWRIVLTALPAGPGERIECHVAQQALHEPCPHSGDVMECASDECPLCGEKLTRCHNSPDGLWDCAMHPEEGAIIRTELQDVRVLARAADGNVLLAMAPQTCADLHIVAQDDALVDSFYILHPGDALAFGRHGDLLGSDDDDFAAYFDDFDDRC